MLKSFKYAFNGIKEALKSEPNLRIHFLIAFLVLTVASILKFSVIEFIILILIVLIVISFELINTVIEKTLDIVHPQKSEEVRIIKDVSAAIVLIAALCSVLIAVFLFIPKIQ